MMEAPPIIMHGLRVHAREHRGPTGIKHACKAHPLDQHRQRPQCWWMLDEQTGRRFGLIEGIYGETVKADDLDLDELIMLTATAPRSRTTRENNLQDSKLSHAVTGAER